MAKKIKKEVKTKKPPKNIRDDKQLKAFVASFFTIIGFIIAIIIWREDEYVMFYAKQGLVLFMGFVIASFFGWIPIIGWAFWVLLIILWVLTWINALSGKIKRTLIITELAEKIKL